MQKHLIALFSALFITFVVGGLVFLYYTRPLKMVTSSLLQPSSTPFNPPDVVAPTQIIPIEATITPAIRVNKKLTVPSNLTNVNYGIYSTELYSIGKVTSGEYTGDEIWMFYKTSGFMCKGSCEKQGGYRFIKHDNELIWLPEISYSRYGATHSEFQETLDELSLLFKSNGYNFNVELGLTITQLEYPDAIIVNNTKLVRNFYDEFAPKDNAAIEKVGQDNLGREIYTTKNALASLPWDQLDKKKLLSTCRGADCLQSNGFYVFKPDGTYNTYVYQPGSFHDSLNISGMVSITNKNYSYTTRKECNGGSVDFTSVIPTRLITESGLQKVTINGTDYYRLPSDSTLLTRFYSYYSSKFPEWGSVLDTDRELVTYDQFVNADPILLKKDQFNRWLAYYNDEFMQPQYCEPIVYLYPEKEMTVNVSLGKTTITAENIARNNNAWSVRALPNGTLFDAANRSYPYIFWEGFAGIVPKQKEGYVVARNELDRFLTDELKIRGLRGREISDFKEAWIAPLSVKPYVQISFIPQDFLDSTVPITISPKPDTVIRVMIQYTPLDAPIAIVAPQRLPTPERKGFTAVEWGGIKR